VTVEVDGLTKIYEGGVKALDNVSLRVESGVFALLGPNGSGKTTLMSILATLLEPTSGTARVDGLDVRRDKPAIRSRLGFLPQDLGMYPSLTAYEFLDYMALLYLMNDRAARRAAIDNALERTNLTHLRDRRVEQMSGGMRQRLGIAQAILNSPQLLIVDEPTVGLDPEERIRARSLLAELGTDRVIILSTHIVADVEAVAEGIAVMHLGTLRFAGTPEEMLASIAGKVWTVEAQPNEMEALRTRYVETGIFRTPTGVQVRLVGDRVDHPTARAAEPTLEDAYIKLMTDGPGDAKVALSA
jgi:ABC-2 type transport system ATP-binding protein